MYFVIKIIQWILYIALFIFVCITLYILRYRKIRERQLANAMEVPSATIVRSNGWRMSSNSSYQLASQGANFLYHWSGTSIPDDGAVNDSENLNEMLPCCVLRSNFDRLCYVDE
uniref:DUF3301 domain-containing protein n=1 Tax=Ascaris lumbricoides TaxID=6252 RepID=A0A0M3IQF9_ASCLU